MAVYYVDSAAGSNTSPYSSWATAATALGTIAGIDAAGDTVYVASTHNESSATALSYTWAGTIGNPVSIICADKTSGAPPTVVATGGTVKTTGSVNLNVATAGLIYVYGMTLEAGSSTGSADVILGGSNAQLPLYDTCTFKLGGLGFSEISLGSTFDEGCRCLGCTFNFGATGHDVKISAGGSAIIEGGAFSGSALATWFNCGTSVNLSVRGLDVSSAGASSHAVVNTAAFSDVDLSNLKLPASWTGSLVSGNLAAGARVSMYCCDSSGTNYKLNIADAAGTIVQETTIVMTGGATDGTTPISWHLSSNSQAVYPTTVLRSDWRAVWNDLTGSAKTLTWNYVADAGVTAGQGAGTANAFQNNQVWVEVAAMDASGNPLATLTRSDLATPLTTPTSNAGGSATWTTTGMTTPKTGICTVSITPELKGPVLARICLATSSKVIYADPMPTLA